MKTNKDLIDSLFYEAVEFSGNTPATEYEKYLEYSKNFAKTFNRLIKEIDDPDDISTIKECINDGFNEDFYLNTEIIISNCSGENEKNLKRNYEILKNHILSEIEFPKEKKETEKPNKETFLKDLFKDANKYTEIMQILTEKGHIDKDTDYWIDTDKGYKSFLASLVKHLHTKKYLERKATNTEIQAICLNTFGVDVKIDTVKRANVFISNYTFIPPNEA